MQLTALDMSKDVRAEALRRIKVAPGLLSIAKVQVNIGSLSEEDIVIRIGELSG
jgi:hypothetical protein